MNEILGDMAAPGSVNRSSKFRPKDDHFTTPREAVYPLVKHLALPPDIWEPACGEGHIAKVFEEYGYAVTASNLVDRGYGKTGVDFLKETKAKAPVLITNPPFSLDEEFVLHALSLKVDIAIFFLRIKWLCGAERYRLIHGITPPCMVLPFIQRVVFYSGDVPREEQPGWNTEDFAWFVWRRTAKGEYYGGTPLIHWLNTDDGLQLDLFRADVPRASLQPPAPERKSDGKKTYPKRARNRKRSGSGNAKG